MVWFCGCRRAGLQERWQKIAGCRPFPLLLLGSVIGMLTAASCPCTDDTGAGSQLSWMRGCWSLWLSCRW